MEQLKKPAEVTEADFRSTAFVKLDRVRGVAERVTIEDNYRVLVEYVQLHDGVPEEIRSYMEAVRSLFLYGWFYYPFYTLAAFLATTAVEMALRTRFPRQGRDYRGLAKLFKRAISEGALRDEKFPSREHVRAHRTMVMEAIRGPEDEPVTLADRPYVEEVAEKLTRIRNDFAHPRAQWIMAPGQAIDFLVLAAEVINQCWQPTN